MPAHAAKTLEPARILPWNRLPKRIPLSDTQTSQSHIVNANTCGSPLSTWIISSHAEKYEVGGTGSKKREND